jgi:hypothetical protein
VRGPPSLYEEVQDDTPEQEIPAASVADREPEKDKQPAISTLSLEQQIATAG